MAPSPEPWRATPLMGVLAELAGLVKLPLNSPLAALRLPLIPLGFTGGVALVKNILLFNTMLSVAPLVMLSGRLPSANTAVITVLLNTGVRSGGLM